MDDELFQAIGERLAFAADAVLKPGGITTGTSARLHFEILNEQEELDFAAMVEDFAYAARLGKTISNGEVLERIEEVAGREPPPGAAELIESFRRNQHAIGGPNEFGPENNAAVVAVAGVALAIAGTAIVVSKAADKLNDGAFDPDGPPLGPDDGPIWPSNPNTGTPLVPFRPGQPGWTDPIPPSWEEKVGQLVVPSVTTALANAL